MRVCVLRQTERENLRIDTTKVCVYVRERERERERDEKIKEI